MFLILFKILLILQNICLKENDSDIHVEFNIYKIEIISESRIVIFWDKHLQILDLKDNSSEASPDNYSQLILYIDDTYLAIQDRKFINNTILEYGDIKINLGNIVLHEY